MVWAASEQPIPFRHNQHSALKLKCGLCHATADTKARAGFPTVATCMICHQAVKKDSPVIQRLAAMDKDATVPVGPLPYRIPDFVFFSHATHHTAKIACESCHGDVFRFEFTRPAVPARMMGCVNCHKAHHANVQCNTCHELTQ